MIQNQLKLIPLSDIQYTRETRQRTDLTSASVFNLACSIALNGLLQNIGIKAETKEVIFGERRLTAFKLLNMAATQTTNRLLDIGLSEAQAAKLQDLAKTHNNYKDWSVIPVRLIKGADKITQDALEFIENVSREELPWQDKAAAAFKIHKAGLTSCALRNKDRPEDALLEHWHDKDTADILGITPQYLNVLIKPFRELETAGKAATQIKEAIKKSPTALSAGNAAKAIKDRHGERVTGQNKLRGTPVKPEKKAPEQETKPEPDSEYIPILNTDFHDFAESYEDEPFNFIHCDFPFGVGYNQGGNFNTNQAQVQQGEYDDSENVYWDLLDTLHDYAKELIAPKAHIMFWFSPKMRDETKRRMRAFFPNILIQDFEMIWVTPTKQTTPDPYRYGQRNYQTAMLLTFGDRKIVQPKRLAFIYEEQVKFHRSQKPTQILSHFFGMFVDSSTRMLDPTCGSASSVITAKQLGAASVLGLELDPVAHKQAIAHWRSTLT